MRRPNLLVSVPAVLLVTACLVTGAKHTSQSQIAPGAVDSCPPSFDAPASCKPSSPVAIELVRHDLGWQVVVEAHETALGVQVRIGTGEVSDTGRTLWNGALQAGERRTFATQMEAGALDAWAVCEIASPVGTTLRSVAVVPGPESRSRLAAAAAESGRIVLDPNTGDGVFEYRGQVEVPR